MKDVSPSGINILKSDKEWIASASMQPTDNGFIAWWQNNVYRSRVTVLGPKGCYDV